MKCYIVALVAITVFAACYNGLPMEHEGRYMWIPDTNGKMHHVDLHDDTPTVRFEPEEDIVYILFTRQNPTEGQIIKKGDTQSLDESNFDFTKPVKFTVHGWNGGPGSSANHKIREAFLDLMEANIITVDWSVGANDGYVAASKNVLTAAASVGDFIDWLNILGVSFSDIHLTGHSLGGQLVGIAARSCTRGLVEYVTGMDPAHPSWTSTSERIRKTDGKYVEIIHTNAAMLGMMDAAGHNDFYANGGKMQVGCADMNCSHGRAVDYMAYSISSDKFAAVQCDTVEEAVAGLANCTATGRLSLGGISIKPEIGIFALNTDSEPPYYLGSTQQ